MEEAAVLANNSSSFSRGGVVVVHTQQCSAPPQPPTWPQVGLSYQQELRALSMTETTGLEHNCHEKPLQALEQSALAHGEDVSSEGSTGKVNQDRGDKDTSKLLRKCPHSRNPSYTQPPARQTSCTLKCWTQKSTHGQKPTCAKYNASWYHC